MLLGREGKLDSLEKNWASDGARFVVIYGGRRTGKTKFLGEFSKGKNGIFFSAQLINSFANLRLLESKKLISRVGDCDNHRQVIVNITPRGQRYLMIIDQQMATLFVGWFSVLGKEETSHLFKILELSSNPDLMTDELKKFSFGE